MTHSDSVFAVKETIRQLGLKPSKAAGQNFLVDKNVLRQIIEAADLRGEETVLEVGPGLGILTEALAERAAKVVAVEIDKRLVLALREILSDFKNIEIVEGDALRILLADHLPEKFVLVANIPYVITSPLLERFLERGPRPERMVLLVQKEVAERITAKSGQMSVLAVAAQFFGRPEIVAKVSKNAFWPRPKVDSALLRISNIRPRVSEIDAPAFFCLVRAGFAAKRKKLAGNLAKFLRRPTKEIEALFERIGLDKNIRAQELSVDYWAAVFQALVDSCRDSERDKCRRWC